MTFHNISYVPQTRQDIRVIVFSVPCGKRAAYLVTVLSGDSDLVRESLAGVGQVAGRAANHGLCLGQEN